MRIPRNLSRLARAILLFLTMAGLGVISATAAPLPMADAVGKRSAALQADVASRDNAGQHIESRNQSWLVFARAERFFQPGARLTLLEFANGSTYGTPRSLIDNPHGMMRDADISFDRSRVVFAWKKSDRLDDYHLYEHHLADGSIRQITSGLGRADDEPAYLPGGGFFRVHPAGTKRAVLVDGDQPPPRSGWLAVSTPTSPENWPIELNTSQSLLRGSDANGMVEAAVAKLRVNAFYQISGISDSSALQTGRDAFPTRPVREM